MLTRLEVSGFKNLLDLKVNFSPFTCVAGPNGAGKSNLADAIQFLSLLASLDLMSAARDVRSSNRGISDPRLLFFTDGEHRVETISLAAEMIVPREVRDDFSRSAKASSTYLRYEIELGYREPAEQDLAGGLVLRRETLGYIQKGEAHKHLLWPHSKQLFRDAVVHSDRRGPDFISTDLAADGTRTIRVHQDGGRRGPPRPAPAEGALRTVVCLTATESEPTILAARREMQSWRMLALEPSAMRSPDSFDTSPYVTASGAHLAAALFRQAMARRDGAAADPEQAYSQIANQLSRLIAVRSITVEKDDKRSLLTLLLQQPGGGFLPASSLSDGTLRFLALSILGRDPEVQGLLCMEEPENGIHPERLPAMVELVRGLAVDPQQPPGPDNPLRQVLVNTHSPSFVQLQNPDDLLFAKPVTVRGPSGRPVQTLRLFPLRDTWRTRAGQSGVSEAEVLSYLTQPPGAQLRFNERGE